MIPAVLLLLLLLMVPLCRPSLLLLDLLLLLAPLPVQQQWQCGLPQDQNQAGLRNHQRWQSGVTCLTCQTTCSTAQKHPLACLLMLRLLH